MKSTKKAFFLIILFALIVAIAFFLSVKEIRKQEGQKSSNQTDQQEKFENSNPPDKIAFNNVELGFDEIDDVENELWDQLISSSPESKEELKRDNFIIEFVNKEQTVALGAYKSHSSRGGANIYAYRTDSSEQWSTKITQEAFSCSDARKLSNDQIEFIKQSGINQCAEFDGKGLMHSEEL